MKKNVGTRIPVFTEHESGLVKGSFDFLGVNHYTATRIKDNPSSLKMDIRDFNADIAVQMIGTMFNLVELVFCILRTFSLFDNIFDFIGWKIS